MNIDNPEDGTGKPIPSKIFRKKHKDNDDNSDGMIFDNQIEFDEESAEEPSGEQRCS